MGDILYVSPVGEVGDNMKISTKGRYGLKAMLDLALYSKNECVALKQVAERQGISERYLEQVFSLLRKGGVIRSIKGPHGGYLLDCNPDTQTVGELLRILEGDLTVTEKKDDLDSMERCINEEVWQKIDKSVNDTVDGITLSDLAEKYKKANDPNAYMFYI